MAERFFRVAVTKVIGITFDTDKLDAEFWDEFNSSITDRGGEDLEYLAGHAAWNYVQGSDDFIEGIGPLDEMNVKIRELDSSTEIQFPEHLPA